jgi:hypothetical protein
VVACAYTSAGTPDVASLSNGRAKSWSGLSNPVVSGAQLVTNDCCPPPLLSTVEASMHACCLCEKHLFMY